MFGLFRWYDRQPEPGRFLWFMALLCVILFLPWVLLPFGLSAMWAQTVSLFFIVVLTAFRFLYIKRNR
jgi:hypothetical protein